MAYEKTVWIAREGENVDKFTKYEETENTVVLFNTPDSITVPGTPFSPANMNKIEDGIYNAHVLIAAETQERQQAVATEILERQQGDQTLHQRIDDLLFFIDYLVTLMESHLGAVNRNFPLVTEEEEYLITEEDDYLVA